MSTYEYEYEEVEQISELRVVTRELIRVLENYIDMFKEGALCFGCTSRKGQRCRECGNKISTTDARKTIARAKRMLKGQGYLLPNGPIELEQKAHFFRLTDDAMNIHAQKGSKVVFAFPDNGRSGDQEDAKQHLKIRETYTVEWTEVGQSRTEVYLKEVPGVGFNSVLFEDARPCE